MFCHFNLVCTDFKFPKNVPNLELAATEFKAKLGVPGATACIDRTHILMK